MKHSMIIIFGVLTLILPAIATVSLASVTITASPRSHSATVDKRLFGNNLLGYDSAECADYGSGIWDPRQKKAVPEVISLAKSLPITVARFPGGTDSELYDWKKTIGSAGSRKKYLYGLDEFLRTCEQLGAEAIITLPYFKGTPNDAANLVRYLNSPDTGSTGGTDWAHTRAMNGHPAPYNVKYFELGNEVFYGVAKNNIRPGDPTKYGKDFIDFKKAMKAVDSGILLGAVTVNSGVSRGMSAWNERVFRAGGGSIDFLIEHTYRPWYTANDMHVNAEYLFADTYTSLADVKSTLTELSRHFEAVTGRKDIPIAITEYNGGFTQEKPSPFRHSLGTALFNAGALSVFMTPELNIFMANYWNFSNEYWGLISNNFHGKSSDLYASYSKRPNYYALQIVAKHAGNELLESSVRENSNLHKINSTDLLNGIPWQKKFIYGANIDIADTGVSVNFTNNADVNFYHVFKKIPVKPNAIYHLSGYLKAENLSDNEGVCLEIQEGRGWNKTNSASSTRRIWGTTNWTHVETDYASLGDSSDINLYVRRPSGKGPVSGKIQVRDLKLVEKRSRDAVGADSLVVTTSMNKKKQQIYITVINTSVFTATPATVDLAHLANKISSIDVDTLTGQSVSSNNENGHQDVVLKQGRLKPVKPDIISYEFPAHSLTAMTVTYQK